MLTISLIELLIIFQAGLEVNQPETLFYFLYVLHLAGLISNAFYLCQNNIFNIFLFSQLPDEHALKNIKN